MDLSGKILIAMPALGDPRFERSVVLMCSHSPEGSMGLIVNKPMPNARFRGLLEQIGVAHDAAARDVAVMYGGPVEPGRGFVLHDGAWVSPNGTMPVPGGLAMTATQDVLEALGRGEGPEHAILALGYSGWGPGQLESEIGRNDWLTSDAAEHLVFGADQGGKWAAALGLLNIDPLTLSATAGRA